MKNKNTVSFADIFHYAEKHHAMSWNKCNDVFFNSELFAFKGHVDLDLKELEGDLADEAMGFDEDQKTARLAIIGFMKEHKVKSLLVLGE